MFRYQIQSITSYPAVIYNIRNFVWYSDIDLQYEEINFTNSRGNNINGLYLDSGSEKTVYYFHWNGWPLYMFFSEIEYIAQLGYNVMAYDYPGYWKSEWFPDDSEVYSTSQEFYDLVDSKKSVNVDSLIIWWYSVGTSTATDFAYNNNFDKLVLIAPIHSRYMMSKFYLWFHLQKFLLLKDSFLNYKKVREIQNPTLIIHGNRDVVVPYEWWKIVYENSVWVPKRFIELKDFWHSFIIEEKWEYLKPIIKSFLEREEKEDEVIRKIEQEISDNTIEAVVPAQKLKSRMWGKNISKTVELDKEVEPEKEIISDSHNWETLEADSSITKFVWPDAPFNDLAYVPDDMKDLVKEYIVDVKGEAQLRAEAQEAFARMSEEFYKEFGEKMVVVSTYRSYAYQKWIKDRWCPDALCAKAGHSEHQSGLAIDLWEATSYEQFMSKDKQKDYYEWMLLHAHTYGFHNSYTNWRAIDGYEREPWHWRYLWFTLASHLKKHNLSFTEFSKE